MVSSARDRSDLDVAAASRERLDAVAAKAGAFEEMQRQLLAELVALWPTSAWLAAGARSAKDYLVAYTHFGPTEAFRLARLGERCAAHPALADAVLGGRLSVARAQSLALWAIDEREPWLADSLPALLRLGEDPAATDAHFGDALRRWAELVDAERRLRREPKHTLTLSQALFGGGEIHASLSPTAFLNVATALERFLQDPDPAGAPHQRSLGERRADALDDLAHHANTHVCGHGDSLDDPLDDDIDWVDLEADDVFDGWADTDLLDQELAAADDADQLDPLRRHIRAVQCQRRRRMRRRVKPRSGVTTVVHIDLQTMAALLDPSTTDPAAVDYEHLVMHGDGWDLARSAAERLLCDSSLVATLFAGRRKVLDANPASPQFTQAQRRALAARDRHCVFPSCARPARHCDAHHLRHREHDGPTVVSNGALLCRFHHRLVHEHHWTLEVDSAVGCWVAIDRDGRRWTGRPAPPEVRGPPDRASPAPSG